MENTIQTPPEGTEQEQVIPQADQEMETPQTPSEEDGSTLEEPQEQSSQEPETPAAPDYKQKFVDSQREAILLNERNRVKDAQLESLTKQDTPTDEAMRQMYPEWDELTEITKKALVRQEALDAKQRRQDEQTRIILARQNLEDQLDDVIENSDYAGKLKGKEADFKRFAKNPKNRGISADVLAKAFLFDAEDEAPVTPPPPDDLQPKPREALPVGSGGPREPLKTKKISIEEAAEIRKTDYKRYKELLDSNQIEELE